MWTATARTAPPGGTTSARKPSRLAAAASDGAEGRRSANAFDVLVERGGGAPPPRWGALKVTTTNMLPGWLRRNGVPYSQNAQITEYFSKVTNPQAGEWFVVTTVVDDPTYLAQQFVTSSNFKKEANDSKWSPTPCMAG